MSGNLPSRPRRDGLWLTREWDARWDAAEQDEAVRAADEQALEARAEIDRAIRDVQVATETYSQAVRWTTQIRVFRHSARGGD